MPKCMMLARVLLLSVATILVVSSSAWSQSETEANTQTLYDRLGGLPAISVVVSDFLDAMVPDSMLNMNPAIADARQRVPKEYLTYHVTSMVCQATGGPCQYSGRDMATSHAHLNITEAEWDRMVVIFTDVLKKHKVPEKESVELMSILGSTKSAIVIVQ